MACIVITRTRHPLDSQWVFFQVWKDGHHVMSLDIPKEAEDLRRLLDEQLTDSEKAQT